MLEGKLNALRSTISKQMKSLLMNRHRLLIYKVINQRYNPTKEEIDSDCTDNADAISWSAQGLSFVTIAVYQHFKEELMKPVGGVAYRNACLA